MDLLSFVPGIPSCFVWFDVQRLLVLRIIPSCSFHRMYLSITASLEALTRALLPKPYHNLLQSSIPSPSDAIRVWFGFVF